MQEEITALSKSVWEKNVTRRRDFHKYPETGWLEMRTSAIIAKILTELGYEVLTGRDVCDGDARMGLPPKDRMKEHAEMVKGQETPLSYLTPDMEEGYTGVIGILRCGRGPVVALRFDIDGLGVVEETDGKHRPAREGFSSANPGMMHACGHDSHTAMGLGTAEVLMKRKDYLHGTVKLIFQPAEEGVRGAGAIVAKGHLDDVDYFLGTHVSPPEGDDDSDVIAGTYGSLATTKYDVYYHGAASHAGGFPEQGRNALLAASCAALNLAAIPRHSGGISRVNTGTLCAGSGRNVIPDSAKMELEIRGETTKINHYMEESAIRICQAAGAMYGCTCDMVLMGAADSHHSDEELVNRIIDVIDRDLPSRKVSHGPMLQNRGSEDISLMMNRVQVRGGQAACMRFITTMESPQHTACFDLDEEVIRLGIEVFSTLTCDLL